MNKLKKFAIWSILTIAIAGIAFKTAKRTEEKPTREVSLTNPQEQINKAYLKANPQNIDKIIYDPTFEESDKFIKKRMYKDFSELEIQQTIQNTRSSSIGHNLAVVGILRYMGDELKRPVFARKELLTSPNIMTIEDITSAIDHEDVHAEEERYGLNFYTHRKRGEEVGNLLNSGKFRVNMILTIGEAGAFAYQLEKIQKEERNPSECLRAHVKKWVSYLTETIEAERKKGTLMPVEEEYYQAKRKMYPRAF